MILSHYIPNQHSVVPFPYVHGHFHIKLYHFSLVTRPSMCFSTIQDFHLSSFLICYFLFLLSKFAAIVYSYLFSLDQSNQSRWPILSGEIYKQPDPNSVMCWSWHHHRILSHFPSVLFHEIAKLRRKHGILKFNQSIKTRLKVSQLSYHFKRDHLSVRRRQRKISYFMMNEIVVPKWRK